MVRGLPGLHAALATHTASAFAPASSIAFTTHAPSQPAAAAAPERTTEAAAAVAEPAGKEASTASADGDEHDGAAAGSNARCAPGAQNPHSRERPVDEDEGQRAGRGRGGWRWWRAADCLGVHLLPAPLEAARGNSGRETRNALRERGTCVSSSEQSAPEQSRTLLCTAAPWSLVARVKRGAWYCSFSYQKSGVGPRTGWRMYRRPYCTVVVVVVLCEGGVKFE